MIARLLDAIPFSRNRLALIFAGSAAAALAVIRMGAHASDTPLPHTCPPSMNDEQAIVEDTEQGLRMQLFDAKGKRVYITTGLYEKSQLVAFADNYCRNPKSIPVAEEYAQGMTYYECRGVKGQFASARLLNIKETRFITGALETVRTDLPFYPLRGEALKYCINAAN